ncbi:CAP domain-containing protein [Rhodovibrionaceae bacterium A322]
MQRRRSYGFRFTKLIGVIALAILLPAGPATAQNPPSATPASPSPQLAQEHLEDLVLEAQTLQLINQHRQNQGLPPLKANPLLATIARGHSQDMADRDYFKHCAPGGICAPERLSKGGYAWQRYGENIAAGTSDPREVLDLWLNSPPHRAILEGQDVSEAGVGYSDGFTLNMQGFWTLLVAEPQRPR